MHQCVSDPSASGRLLLYRMNSHISRRMCRRCSDVVSVARGRDVRLNRTRCCCNAPSDETLSDMSIPLTLVSSEILGCCKISRAVGYDDTVSLAAASIRRRERLLFFQYSKMYNTRRERFSHLDESKVTELLLQWVSVYAFRHVYSFPTLYPGGIHLWLETIFSTRFSISG